MISPPKSVNLDLVSLNKDLKIAISQKTMDGFFCQGPFCVHNGVVFQKNALPTLFNFVRVRKSHQPHVLDVVFQKFKPDLPLGLKSIGSLLVC